MYAGLLPETNAFSASFENRPNNSDVHFFTRNSDGYPKSMREKLIMKDAEKFRMITEHISGGLK